MNTSKFYIGTIREGNGDMEYDTRFVFTTPTNPGDHVDAVAMAWRGCTQDDYDGEVDGYWCDGTLVMPMDFDEISEKDFEVLRKYLAVL